MSSVVQKNVKCCSKSQKFLIAGEIPEIVKAVARLPENTRCLLQLPIAVYGLLLIASNLSMADMARLHTYIRPLKLAYVDAGP